MTHSSPLFVDWTGWLELAAEAQKSYLGEPSHTGFDFVFREASCSLPSFEMHTMAGGFRLDATIQIESKVLFALGVMSIEPLNCGRHMANPLA